MQRAVCSSVQQCAAYCGPVVGVHGDDMGPDGVCGWRRGKVAGAGTLGRIGGPGELEARTRTLTHPPTGTPARAGGGVGGWALGGGGRWGGQGRGRGSGV